MSDDVKRFEFTVSLSVQGGAEEHNVDFSEKFDTALRSVLKDYPAISDYFVSQVEEGTGISFGLRFEKIAENSIERIVNEVLDKVVRQAALAAGTPETPPVREESTLVSV